MQKRVIIKSLKSDKGRLDSQGNVEVIFKVSSNDTRITLEQELILTKSQDGWTAKMPMDKFPPQETATDSALKLADWMEKMAAAIKDHDFDLIDLNKL